MIIQLYCANCNEVVAISETKTKNILFCSDECMEEYKEIEKQEQEEDEEETSVAEKEEEKDESN